MQPEGSTHGGVAVAVVRRVVRAAARMNIFEEEVEKKERARLHRSGS